MSEKLPTWYHFPHVSGVRYQGVRDLLGQCLLRNAACALIYPVSPGFLNTGPSLQQLLSAPSLPRETSGTRGSMAHSVLRREESQVQGMCQRTVF